VWLIRGLLQRRYLYALTAPAGTGKTAVALTLAAYVALGRDIGDYKVNPGRVLYLAGENPDDIKTRWLLMAEAMCLDPTAIPVDFVFGTPPYAKIVQEAEAAGREYVLVIVDTDQAFFDKPDGDGMNGNDNRKQWAQELRLGTNLPGGPTMLVLAHPPKVDRQPPYRPFGGNAFLNEIDGNMYLQRQNGFILLNRDPEKFRGPEFSALAFELKSVASAERQDGDGNPALSVRAVPLKADEYDAWKAKKDTAEARLRQIWKDNPGLSNSAYAELFGFEEPKGKGKNKASRLIKKWHEAEADE
jgi:hypothetical protein